MQSAAGDLQIQNALVTVRKEDGALLASFADGGISMDRDVTVAAASTLNATTADITQLTVGSTAATGAFSSNSSVTANLEVVSNLRLEAPLVRCDPTAPWSTTPSVSTGASSSPRRTTRPQGAGASWWRWPTAAVQLNALNQFISLNTTSGIANLAWNPTRGEAATAK